LEHPKHFLVGDNGVLDDLSEPLIELATRQCFQNIEIIDYQRGLMENADQIFPARVSTPVLPPIELSTIASSVVGIWTCGMPR
jgi:hypothetical protein